ncbi:DsbA family oxidoreductase [Sandaracinobacter sp. RS1-74]|uniref:DsbA family oxidoreductase n=1 Tax=Sandaracinobacteroides sayramensis TaxID=2913411 RepID=UPI001EDC0EB3|nr:DsbA family oxidoreductase [Sandaracinobacteroides sayramensis]MCG2839408.1 DsbA family oxidoreductase [Sandaracinobacteroides sayramensis]
MARRTIRVDIVSDVVCPWCFIGYRQLQRALEIADLEGDIRWHPFELNPDMPPEGEDVAEHIARKYGATPEQMAATRQQMQRIAEPLGIDFASRSDRIWNSFAAHQLLHWARESGRQTDLQLKLFEAYFTQGQNIGDEAVLLDAVDAVGLNRAEAAAVLADGRFAGPVRALEARWAEMGITGVPAMILAERGLVVGAQEPERLAIGLGRMAAAQE